MDARRQIGFKLSDLERLRSAPVLLSAAGSAFLALAYYVTARLGLVLQLPGTNASPVWPPSGVALAALLFFGVELWPGVIVGAFLANFFTLPSGTSGLLASMVIAIGSTLEQVTAWLLLRRLVATGSFFEKTRSIFWFVATALFSCTVGSTIGVTALWSTGIVPRSIYGSAWFTWWLGDTAGMLVLAPAIYFWLRMPVRNYSKPRLLEFIALAGVTVAIAEIRFGGWFGGEIANNLPYLVVLSLMWAAFRFGPGETSTTAVLTAAIAIIHTWQHMAGGDAVETAGRVFAPFVSPTLTPNQSMLMLQVFVCAVSLTGLTLAAAIAERTHFEEELTEAEARLRTIFEQAAVGVALIETATGRFVRVNDRYCRLVGYTAKEMMGMNFQQITHPEDLQRDTDNMRRIIAGEIGEFTMEKRYYRKDGSTVWVNLTVSPTWRANEKPEFHIAVAEDITTRRQAEEALRTAHAKLQQLSRALIRVRDEERQHLARELHDEIGQNLAALRINMQLLRDADGPRRTRIDDSVAIIDHILDEVRDLSLSLRPPLLNEAGLTVALRSYLEEQSARSGLSIDFASTADGKSLPSEIALALFRIAQEATTNAIRHSQAKRVLVSLDHIKDQIKLVVRDNGIGISPQFREKAGDRRKLGLQGIEERTAMLGGEFALRSNPGAGTAVSVQVPFKSS